MAGQISMGARREIKAAVAERYRVAGRAQKGRILDELCKVTGWHRKHAVRALTDRPAAGPDAARQRTSTYGVVVKDALAALWEASDRICGKRLKVMIPTLLPALERHGRLKLGAADRVLVLAISAATIDRLLADTKIAAAGGKRRRVGFYSAIRREVPIRTFNDWQDPPPGFCEIDMVAHGGTSVAGSFIQTLTMVDVATGWTECLPLVTREGSLVVEAIKRAQSLFPWIILGADFDNDSAFMNDIVVPWCRAQKIEVTRSRAYKKNDQAFVEQKNGAVVRRLMGYGRFDGIETAQVMARLYAAARLHVNFFQPSFKLKEKHPKVPRKIKQRLRAQYRTLDPVVLLSEIRAAQEELGRRIDRRGLAAASQMQLPVSNTADFAQTLGMSIKAGEPRGTHRRAKGKYKTRIRMPSKLDPHLAIIESWLAAEPQLTALAIVERLAQRDANQFGPKQHSIVQRLLKALRRKAAERLIAATTTGAAEVRKSDACGGKTAVELRPPSVLPPPNRDPPHNPSAHEERLLGSIPP